MKKIVICAVLLASISAPALAMDLASARAAGLVCEVGDGYIKATGSSAADVVASVNAGRKAEYTKISSQNGQSVDVVAKLAGAQIIAKGNKACK